MEKPEIIVEYEPTFYCPICGEEYCYEEDAIKCRDKCFEIQLEQEKIEKTKEALKPLKGQIQFFDNCFSEYE